MSGFLMWFLVQLSCGPQLGSLERIANETAAQPVLLSDLQDQCWLPQVHSTLYACHNQRKYLSPSL